MGVFIRKAMESDVDPINRIAATSWYHTYKEIYDTEEIEKWIDRNYSPEALQKHISMVEGDRNYLFIVALMENNIVGFMEMKIKNQIAHLLRIYLNPDHIGNGIGTELLRHGENWMLSNGKRQLTVSVHKKNLPGMKFSDSRGFRFKEEIEEDIILEKNLAGS